MSQETRPVGHYYAKALGFDKPVILYWDGENWNCDLPIKIEASHVTVLRPVPEYQEQPVEELTVSSALEILSKGESLPDGWVLENVQGWVVKSVCLNQLSCKDVYPYSCELYMYRFKLTNQITLDGRYWAVQRPSPFDLILKKSNKD